ncbi:MAG: hypothetical protein ABSD38_21505 [Syntrophorhabdales bacterium]|jgi:hypothetical protein
MKEAFNVDEEWWRKQISRLCYSLVFTSGSSLSPTVFQDLMTGRWYRQNRV